MTSKIYHLQMIQSIISRLSSNSFLIKGWSITVVSAMIALLARNVEKRYVLFSLLPIMMFWFLDATYLCNERRFKSLYNETRLLDESKIDFSMEVKRFKKDNNWLGTFFSWSILLFYIAMILTVGIIYWWL